MDSAQMDFPHFIENLRSNALERAQLAEELFSRHGDDDFRCQALRAQGEILAYDMVLRRLDSEPIANPPSFR